MAGQIVNAQGYDQDIAAVNEGKLVLLHRWVGGHILLMFYDPQMPDWTANPIEHPSAEEIEEKIRDIEEECFGPAKPEKYATGYVFWVFEENSNGYLVLEGKKYAQLDIYDYVIWTDEHQVRQKYHEVVARARLEE